MANCKDNDHKLGNMIIDDEINAHKVCSKCGFIQKYKKRTLQEVDEMTLDEIMSLQNEQDLEYKNGE